MVIIGTLFLKVRLIEKPCEKCHQLKGLRCERDKRLLMLAEVMVMRFPGHVVSSAAVINDDGRRPDDLRSVRT